MDDTTSRPEILDYLNYRVYLKDLMNYFKKEKSLITPKYLLSELQISSTGYISNIYTGKKNLSVVQAQIVSKAIRLSMLESEYFELMVQFTQSKNREQKDAIFQKLIVYQNSKFKHIEADKLNLFSKWYFVFIREIISFFPFKSGYTQLARMLQPSISSLQAKEAIAVLENLELIKKDSSGYYVQNDPAISTGDELSSVELCSFQAHTMEMAKSALEEFEASERDISNLTMSLSKDGFNRIKKEVQYFRKKISRIALEEKNMTRVYQLNLQLFPVSKEAKGKTYE